MTTTDELNIEPRGYDAEGGACYDDDLLDLRWGTLLEDVQQGLDLEVGVHALIYTDNVDLIRKGVEVIGLLAERHIRRQGHPGLLDEESGRAWHREMRVTDLRAHRERYAELAARAGWPDEPADLDDEQMDQAVIHVLMPHLLDEGKWERPDN